MDSSVRASTLLPTIKCSTCSSEIEISRLGDHVCAAPTPSPKPPMDLLNAKLATMNANLGNAPSHFRLGRIAPSRIDSDAASTRVSFPANLFVADIDRSPFHRP
jgi:hypothetical protein